MLLVLLLVLFVVVMVVVVFVILALFWFSYFAYFFRKGGSVVESGREFAVTAGKGRWEGGRESKRGMMKEGGKQD